MRKLILFLLVLCIMGFISCGGAKPTIKLEKTTFCPGEEITVNFSAPSSFPENAWIGIIPSDVPHGSESESDQHDIAYIYLEKRTSGSLYFLAPGQAGSYDFRMYDTDDDGKEVVSVSFLVKIVSEGAELKLDKATYTPGEEIRLTFSAPASFGPNAWVGIIPSDVPHGNEEENDRHDLDYQHLDKRTKGLFVFNAPEKPGSYDFRLHDTDENGNEITHVTFTVKAK